MLPYTLRLSVHCPVIHRTIGPLICVAATLLTVQPAWGRSYRITVNAAANDKNPDAQLTFTEALLFLNQEFASSPDAPVLGRPLSVGESGWVDEFTEEGGRNEIRFAIPGAGPHVLVAPPGGFPALFAAGVLIDGFSQSGAKPNTSPITSANNATLKLVLDARNLEAAPGADAPPDYSFQIRAADVRLRGFSILTSGNSETYGLQFGAGASGGQVSGCWFGIAPDGQLSPGGEVGLAAYGSEGGHVFGTNGDGVDDRSEFNVFVALAIAVQFEDTRDIRVSGNLMGVLPDGRTLPPEEIRLDLEGDAIEGAGLAGTILIGTDGDGLADADEANVIGGMRDDVIEFYGDVEDVIFAGNRVGIAGDGTTVLPVNKVFRTRAIRLRAGSDLNGTADAAEANWIANATGYLFNHGPDRHLDLRGNRLTNNGGDPLFNAVEQSLAGGLAGGAADVAPALDAASTRKRLQGEFRAVPPAGQPVARLDLYRADPTAAAAGFSPQGAEWLGTFADNGPLDADPILGRFAFDLGGLNLPAGELSVVAASYLKPDANQFTTTPFSGVVVLPAVPVDPQLNYTRVGTDVQLTWDAAGYQLQTRAILDAGDWTTVSGTSPVIVRPEQGSGYYRLTKAGSQ